MNKEDLLKDYKRALENEVELKQALMEAKYNLNCVWFRKYLELRVSDSFAKKPTEKEIEGMIVLDDSYVECVKISDQAFLAHRQISSNIKFLEACIAFETSEERRS